MPSSTEACSFSKFFFLANSCETRASMSLSYRAAAVSAASPTLSIPTIRNDAKALERFFMVLLLHSPISINYSVNLLDAVFQQSIRGLERLLLTVLTHCYEESCVYLNMIVITMIMKKWRKILRPKLNRDRLRV